MIYFHVKIRDRKSAGEIGWIASFVMPAESESQAFEIVRLAYPLAMEHHVKRIYG